MWRRWMNSTPRRHEVPPSNSETIPRYQRHLGRLRIRERSLMVCLSAGRPIGMAIAHLPLVRLRGDFKPKQARGLWGKALVGFRETSPWHCPGRAHTRPDSGFSENQRQTCNSVCTCGGGGTPADIGSRGLSGNDRIIGLWRSHSHTRRISHAPTTTWPHLTQKNARRISLRTFFENGIV